MALGISVRWEAEANDLREVSGCPACVGTGTTRQARKLLAADVDPMAQRKAAKIAKQEANENSFDSVARKWLEHWREGKSLRHAEGTRRRLEANILPYIGPRPIAEIEALELVTLIKGIESRSARDIAKRALETTGQIFRYGIAHRLCETQPSKRDPSVATS